MSITPTRERILDEAMRLFSEQGFKATTIVQIETAAGLTPGAGGIYHHFPSKQALLAAGVQRHLQRLDALRDIRHVFADLGDIEVELTITARYILAELDRESELLRILATEAGARSGPLKDATDRLIGASMDGFSSWLQARSKRELSTQQAHALANLSLGALICTRLLRGVVARTEELDDEQLVDAWVALLAPALRS